MMDGDPQVRANAQALLEALVGGQMNNPAALQSMLTGNIVGDNNDSGSGSGDVVTDPQQQQAGVAGLANDLTETLLNFSGQLGSGGGDGSSSLSSLQQQQQQQQQDAIAAAAEHALGMLTGNVNKNNNSGEAINLVDDFSQLQQLLNEEIMLQNQQQQQQQP